MSNPPVQLRHPYLGDGADGARRSAQIDLEEADCLPPGEQRDDCLLSAKRWILQAEHLEEEIEGRQGP
ncbi:hypothetical protein GA707_18535 [Nostocoides sp. F2B08]|uniref:hypothetical protein n=1 Tax=Nostocoides sp. F2B08 TaxID=2653936 RepID=UPI001263552C|nr:hypothetical protein [Tetrasphaera sp. F2B08]KAB7740898.1 hypothetical protein GA707_18535 [Tetrasphaera sp. F2B08]